MSQLTEEGDLMEDVLNEYFDALLPDVHLDPLERGINNLGFDQNSVLVDFSLNQGLENIVLNEVVAEHFDVEVTSISYIKIDTRETFKHLFSETLYSLYLVAC